MRNNKMSLPGLTFPYTGIPLAVYIQTTNYMTVLSYSFMIKQLGSLETRLYMCSSLVYYSTINLQTPQHRNTESTLTVCFYLRSGFESVSEFILFFSDEQEVRKTSLLFHLKYVIWDALIHIIPYHYDLVQ